MNPVMQALQNLDPGIVSFLADVFALLGGAGYGLQLHALLRIDMREGQNYLLYGLYGMLLGFACNLLELWGFYPVGMPIVLLGMSVMLLGIAHLARYGKVFIGTRRVLGLWMRYWIFAIFLTVATASLLLLCALVLENTRLLVFTRAMNAAIELAIGLCVGVYVLCAHKETVSWSGYWVLTLFAAMLLFCGGITIYPLYDTPLHGWPLWVWRLISWHLPIAALLFIAGVLLLLTAQARLLFNNLAHLDVQTHALNRPAFQEAITLLGQYLQRCGARSGLMGHASHAENDVSPDIPPSRGCPEKNGFAYLLFDIDGFQQINRQHGLFAGDALIVQIARQIHLNLRPGDLFARIHSDVFGVVLRGVEGEMALAIGQRIRRKLAAHVFHHQQTLLRCTVSFGLTDSGTVGVAFAQLHAAAELALRQTKTTGGNSGQCYTPPSLPEEHPACRTSPSQSTDG